MKLGGRTQFAPTVVKPTFHCNLRDVEDAVPYNVAEKLHLPMPPLCKGRWRDEVVTEGL